MSAFWIAPLGLAALALAWSAVQRCWVRHMQQPEHTDALARPGCCGVPCGPGACADAAAGCAATTQRRVARTEEESPS